MRGEKTKEVMEGRKYQWLLMRRKESRKRGMERGRRLR